MTEAMPFLQKAILLSYDPLPLVVVFFFFDVVILHISRTNLRWPKPYETLAFLCGNTVLDIRFLLFLQQVDVLYPQIFVGFFAPNSSKAFLHLMKPNLLFVFFPELSEETNLSLNNIFSRILT